MFYTEYNSISFFTASCPVPNSIALKVNGQRHCKGQQMTKCGDCISCVYMRPIFTIEFKLFPKIRSFLVIWE